MMETARQTSASFVRQTQHGMSSKVLTAIFSIRRLARAAISLLRLITMATARATWPFSARQTLRGTSQTARRDRQRHKPTAAQTIFLFHLTMTEMEEPT